MNARKLSTLIYSALLIFSVMLMTSTAVEVYSQSDVVIIEDCIPNGISKPDDMPCCDGLVAYSPSAYAGMDVCIPKWKAVLNTSAQSPFTWTIILVLGIGLYLWLFRGDKKKKT